MNLIKKIKEKQKEKELKRLAGQILKLARRINQQGAKNENRI